MSGDSHITYSQLRQRVDDLRDTIENFWEVDRVFLFDDRERQVHIKLIRSAHAS